MVYENIKRICYEQGKTIQRLEEDLDLPRGSVYKYQDHNPSAEKIKRIAEYLHCSMDVLMRDS